MRIDGAKLVFELRKKDMTQAELAKKSGISRGTVCGVAAGRRCSDEVAEKIAGALHVDVSELTE